MMHHYTKEYGSYYLKDKSDIIIFMSDEISVLYDPEEKIIYKHGRPESVEKFLKNHRSMWKTESFITITSSKWKVEILNKMLDNSGFITDFTKQSPLFFED